MYAADPFPTDDAIREILRQRIDEQHRGVAIVVGVVDEHGSRVVSYGHQRAGGGNAVDAQTMFEIGSVTKVFTSVLLAQAVTRGDVRLDDPIAKYLPPTVKVPARNGKQITLLDLATHRSGLPRLPGNLTSKYAEDPYADYTAEQLYGFLSGYALTRDIGEQYEYSNLGAALLGHVLALRAGQPYETLIEEKICQPLGLKNTVITLTPAECEHLAVPYKEDLSPTKNWELAVFAGAGGLRSNVADLLRFVSANLDLVPCPFAAALHDTQQKRAAAGNPTSDIGLAWHILREHEPPIIMHNGGTGGYRSFVGFVPAEKRGVVVLSNSANSVDDIGLHLLNPAYPLEKSPFSLRPETGEQCVGHYAFTPDFILHVTRQGQRYFAQATGQGNLEIFPASDTEFSYHAVEASLTFVRDAQGHAVSLTLHQNGMDQSARRLTPAEEAALPKPKTVITLPSETGDLYLGRYELSPGKIFTVSREGDRYFAQLTGQSRNEIFPSAATEFFYKVVDAQLTFTADPQGKVNSLTLHQRGDFVAKRLP